MYWRDGKWLISFYIPSLKNGVSAGSSVAVNTPVTTRERLPTAPQSSLSSVALLVPMTCAAVPNATPPAPLRLEFGTARTAPLPQILPPMPVTIMAALVMAPIPPYCSDKAMPIAVVTLLGSSEMTSRTFSPNKRPRPKMQPRLVSVPPATPANIAGKSLRSIRSCSYIGSTRQMVAGVSGQLSFAQPLWYSSFGSFSRSSTAAINITDTTMGLHRGLFHFFRRLSSAQAESACRIHQTSAP